jgi:hypothetical protein
MIQNEGTTRSQHNKTPARCSRQTGVGVAKSTFALGAISRAKPWTFNWVADAKWSATGFPRVASCLWHTLPLVDDTYDLRGGLASCQGVNWKDAILVGSRLPGASEGRLLYMRSARSRRDDSVRVLGFSTAPQYPSNRDYQQPGTVPACTLVKNELERTTCRSSPISHKKSRGFPSSWKKSTRNGLDCRNGSTSWRSPSACCRALAKRLQCQELVPVQLHPKRKDSAAVRGPRQGSHSQPTPKLSRSRSARRHFAP